MTWEEAAAFCETTYGVYVCREEGNEYFICPECDDPILKEDWNEFSICPVCEFDWREDL